MPQRLTAAIYVRVSTVDQATEGVSVEAQQTKLAEWCVANDYELLAIHTDAGLSGGRADNRPALQAALKPRWARRKQLAFRVHAKLSQNLRALCEQHI